MPGLELLLFIVLMFFYVATALFLNFILLFSYKLIVQSILVVRNKALTLKTQERKQES